MSYFFFNFSSICIIFIFISSMRSIQYASKKSVRTEPVITAQLPLKSTVKYGVLLVRCGESTE